VAYRLKPHRPVAREIRRVVRKQLALAIGDLQRIGDPQSDAAVHEARRHVKKVRAAVRLVQPVLAETYALLNMHMRTASRLLAPVADGEAVVDTIGRLREQFGSQFPQRALTSIRAALVERATRIDRKAELDRVLQKTTHILRAELRRVPTWQLTEGGFRAIGPGLERSFRRARRAMKRATRQPTIKNYHAWRQRVKDLWFQIRLLEERCGSRLSADERRLETLDGRLGEHHNVALLEAVLMREALVSRPQTARCLRVLRRYQTELRHRAHVVGKRIFEEKAGAFRHRVRQYWQMTRRGVRTGQTRMAPCRRAA
jgi:CHAD domain-containing protein